VTASTSRAAWLAASAGIGAGTAATFLGLVRLARHPDRPWSDVPNPSYGKQPEHVDELRRLLTEDLWLVGASTLLLLAAVDALVVPAARRPDPPLGPWALVLTVGWTAAALARVVWMYARRCAVPRDEDA